MARVEEKCGKTGLLHMENAGNWSSHDYWLKYPKDEPENPEDITCYYDWRKENHTVYQIDFHKNGVTLEEYMGRYHQDPPEGSGPVSYTHLNDRCNSDFGVNIVSLDKFFFVLGQHEHPP